MRKLLSLAGLALLAVVICGCSDNTGGTPSKAIDVRISIDAGADTRTAIEYDPESGLYVPKWSVGDRMGLYTSHGHDNIECTAALDNEEGRSATFTGIIGSATPGEHTFYGYYPYNDGAGVDRCSVPVEVATQQNPSATSFDGASDILVAEPVSADIDAGELSLTFRYKRLAAIVRLEIDCTLNNIGPEDIVERVVLSAPGSALAGVRILDLETGVVGNFSGETAESIEAVCVENTAVSGAIIWMLVYPALLEAGSAMDFTVETDSHTITKNIILVTDIELLAGEITPLRLSLAGGDDRISVTPRAVEYELCYSYNGEVLNSNNSTVYGTYSKTVSGVDWVVSYGCNQAQHITNKGLWVGSNDNQNTNIPNTVLAGDVFGPIGAALGIPAATTRVAAILETTPMMDIAKIEFSCQSVNQPAYSTVSLVYSTDGGQTYNQMGEILRLNPVPSGEPLEFVFGESIPSAIYAIVFRSSQNGSAEYLQVRVPAIKFYRK